MRQCDPRLTPRAGWSAQWGWALISAAALVAFLPSTTANADPPPPPPPSSEAVPSPPDPNAAQDVAPDQPAPPGLGAPIDQTAAPTDAITPPAPPGPEPGRVYNAVGGLSFVVPPGWTNADPSRLSYGSALLTKTAPNGETVAPTDTGIILGKLDLKLYAGAEPDDSKAAIRLASDMGEFFMPFQGTRINQHVAPLNAGGIPGAASYYEVKFNDTTKPNGQIWAAAIGTVTSRTGAQPAQGNRWFVVWLGNANDPVDTAAAFALAQSIQPWTPPPPPEAPQPDQNGPPPAPAPQPGQAPAPPQVGVPVPVPPESAPGMAPPS